MPWIARLALMMACSMPVFDSAPTLAQQALGDGALSIDAADGVEWRREERLFIAEGDAVARQGDVVLNGQRLVAAYREDAAGDIQIFRLDAEGDVRIENKGDVASGARAAFDLDAGKIEMTGPGLRYENGDAAVTATETMTYDVKAKRAVARGGAEVVDPNGRITASVIEARFQGDGDALQQATAAGNVVITTPSEVIRADRAAYDFMARKATATGNVRITRGRNVLTGERADIDFATGISRLSGGASGQGGGNRVRGLVFPNATK